MPSHPASTIDDPPVPPLKQLRDARGLTQKDVAFGAGVAVGIISDLENYPTYRPSRKIQQKLAAFLEVEMDLICPPRTAESIATSTPDCHTKC